MSISDAGKVCLFSGISGVLTVGGKPAANVRLVRAAAFGKSKTDETVTDAEGNFEFPPVFDRTITKFLPQEFIAKQDIVAIYQEKELYRWYDYLLQLDNYSYKEPRMTEQSPLSKPAAWNAVSDVYTTDFMPLFSLYAKDAVALAELSTEAHVLDVAAGPGTLSLLVAEQVRNVSAVDFADDMVTILKQRVADAGLTHVDARTADGQALPFEKDTFDAAFSMFGLMFFPDRHAGFSELRRVLKPGGRAVVSSWAPINEAPLLAALFDSLNTLLPDLAFGGRAPAPLSDAAGFNNEMAAAGFSDVRIHTVKHRLEVPSVQKFWESQEKASAPIVLLRSRLSEDEWQRIAAQVVERVEKKCGAGPHSLTWPARLGVGVA